MFKFLSKIREFLKYRVCLGREPGPLGPGTIVLLPLLRETLSCGLTGIITVKKSGPAGANPGLFQEAEGLFSSLRKSGLKQIFSGKIISPHYFGGTDQLKKLQEAIACWKLDTFFRDIYFDRGKSGILKGLSAAMKDFLHEQESLLQENAARLTTEDLETVNSRLIILKDLQWALERDILLNIGQISDLAAAGKNGSKISAEALNKYRQVNFLLNCLDRLEVRGRDSAGVQVSFMVSREDDFAALVEKLRSKGLLDAFLKRSEGGDLLNGSINVSRRAGRVSVAFTYKTASVIGELGRNVRELRASIRSDEIFQLFADLPVDFDVSFAHTRWASVGSITEENCHPVNNFTLQETSPGEMPPGGLCAIPAEIDFSTPNAVKSYPAYGQGNWGISVVLNGDIDNYPELRAELEEAHQVRIAPELTTDTKIIPLQIDKYLKNGKRFADAFRLALNDFEGSHAIAAISNLEPGKVFLALRGSGQSIYIGICPDRYIFSSELYGIVEATQMFVKMDGEETLNGETRSAGQVVILDQSGAGGLDGINAFFYSGDPLQLTEKDIKVAEITTRDIDRGNFPHFFLKEITESADSARKTMLGKYRLARRKSRWELSFNLGEDILPALIRQGLKEKRIRNIVLIGHGTAAVAGAAVADGMQRYLHGSGIKVDAKRASELSGFFMIEDLRDTLVIPVTQSGTTTDTNRAVAMAAERGACVIAIVNRRQSDITHKADGVFYTSDGRDIEMSVASTKAFYSQIVAGHMLGLAIADLMGTLSRDGLADELLRLEQVPEMMGRVLLKKDEIRQSVARTAKHKKYWAVVGSGPNKAAADEIRIKLSELCYKTISSDVTEDKKHIDLSSEPLIIVCAAGLPEAVMGDIVKDVAIFKAHKAAVVVFADEGEDRFHAFADAVITLPRTDPPLSVILNTMAGHLWGYYAARTIDEDASMFQEFRSRLNAEMVRHDRESLYLFERLMDRGVYRVIDDFSSKFNQKRSSGAFSLTNVKTISDIALLMKYASGKLPLEDFWTEFPGYDSPIELLNISIGHAIDELSRPIDAIRHQAKTVTVGTSRKEELPRGILFDLLVQLDFTARTLSSRNILSLGRIQKAISKVKGFTLYTVDMLDAEGKPTESSVIAIRSRGGISLGMSSRAEKPSPLLGTKNMIVRTGHVYIGAGKADRAPIVIIPLVGEGKAIRDLLLIHVEYNNDLSIADKKDALGYRYHDIRNFVMEYNLPWNDGCLEGIPTGFLLGESVETVAAEIRKRLAKSKPAKTLKIKSLK